jgi:hypothetical protein
MDSVENASNSIDKYHCESCQIICSKKSDWTRHLSTRKHSRTTENIRLKTIKGVDLNDHMCICGNVYKYMSGLCKHKNRCTYVEPAPNSDLDNDNDSGSYELSSPSITNDVVLEMIKQNQELKDLLMEERNEFKNYFIEHSNKMVELSKHNVVVHNNNTNNNQFNLNVFLNEKCKNAISLEDFVESLQINAQTAEYVGKHGFVNGITNIFMTGLKQLEVHMRPIHCTDLKRETLYVKGIEIWSKDNDTNTQMMGAIKDVSTKNMKQLPVWIEENPDSKICGTDKYEEQLKIMMGMLDVDTNKEKVLKNLAKQVYIDRSMK